MPNYMLLLHWDPSSRDNWTADELQQSYAKYMAWREKPFVLDAKRLGADAGRVLRARGGKPVASDGPYSETKEMLGGYYTIEAADYDQAVARTLDHPHLAAGGTIEVREVWVPAAVA